MLILILTDVQYLENVVFILWKRFARDQMHSFSVSHNLMKKNPLPAKISDFPHPYHYLENPDQWHIQGF